MNPVNPIVVQHIYFWLKFIGAAGSASVAVFGVYKYFNAVYKQRQNLDNTVTLLATNHLPHLQKSVDEHGEALKALTSDVRDIGTKVDGVEKRQEDLRKGVHTISDAFLRHLEASSKEASRKRRKSNAV
jgi:hypothetical protein